MRAKRWRSIALAVLLLIMPAYYLFLAYIEQSSGTLSSGLEFMRFAWTPPFIIAVLLLFTSRTWVRVVCGVLLACFAFWTLTALYP